MPCYAARDSQDAGSPLLGAVTYSSIVSVDSDSIGPIRTGTTWQLRSTGPTDRRTLTQAREQLRTIKHHAEHKQRRYLNQ